MYSKCIYKPFLKQKNLKANRNYLSNVTYKNGTLTLGQVNKSKNCRKFNNNSYFPPQAITLPSQSQIVIAGAGTVANSVAYHLVINGWTDILVLEQDRYTLIS